MTRKILKKGMKIRNIMHSKPSIVKSSDKLLTNSSKFLQIKYLKSLI